MKLSKCNDTKIQYACNYVIYTQTLVGRLRTETTTTRRALFENFFGSALLHFFGPSPESSRFNEEVLEFVQFSVAIRILFPL
jgi:hypothetical protein